MNEQMEEWYEKVIIMLDDAELIDLLKKMVTFPSMSRTVGESNLAQFLYEYLKGIGLATQLQQVEKGRFNVVGTLKGTGGGKSLLFNGHMDVNSPAVGWTKDPFGGVIENGYMYGMGVVNMKGGDAAFIAAAKAVQKAGIPLRGDVILSLVVGELQGGIGTIHMIEEGINADAFIVAEPTELLLLVKHMGMVHVNISTIGKSCHVSSREKGIHAIQSMYEIISNIEKNAEAFQPKLFERMNVGAIRGGLTEKFHSWRPSLLPDYCVATCDFRILPGQTEMKLVEGLKGIAKKVKAERPGLDVKIELLKPPSYYHMPPFEVEENEPIVRTVMESHKYVAGEETMVADFPPYIFYASDASHLNTKGNIPGVVYGPGGATVSHPDERIRVDDIITAARVYAMSILSFCA